MPFQPGNTYGGKRANAGRPPKIKKEVEKVAAEIARDFIDENIRPVLDNYLKLAKGWNETRYSDGGMAYDVFCHDGPTTRHFVDKVLPDEQNANSPLSLSIVIANAVIQREDSQPDLRADSFQIRLGGNNGQNGNGSDGA